MTFTRDGDAETRTLLFSDIEGSTRLAEATAGRYPEILATHRRLIRASMARHSGVEQSTEGDSFLVLFTSARDAIGAAVDAQLALSSHPWAVGEQVRVRMGLHTGEITWSDNDIVGLSIHEAARIMGAANGGQILVSPVVWSLGESSSDEFSATSLGPHRLKDFDDPVELLQICHPDLREDFPPPRARAAHADLPVPRTSFIGREREVAEVLALVSNTRHVTLTGVGGTGKTRLALEVARQAARRHPDGAFLVDLAPVADPSGVLAAIANGIKAQGDPSDLAAMLVSYLSDRVALIVLDNCEHLLDTCAEVVDLLLSQCPGVVVLATSREALQIDGEQTFSVPSLAADDAGGEAVQLFVSRAMSVKPAFTINDGNRADVVAICQRLDGIPLAIELAAARVDHLSVADIARRLDDRFGLLVGGSRRRAQRQQTLQAAMDWSWDLLADGDRELLRRLAVFAGPFTLESAEAVCAVPSSVTVLGSLVAKSLVAMQPESSPTKYRLLETVRLYAQDRLVDADEAVMTRDAHRDWYLAWTEGYAVDDFLESRAMNRINNDYGNIRAAMDWSRTQERGDLAGRQLVAVASALTHQAGVYEELRLRLTDLSEDERLPTDLRADALALLALVVMMGGDFGLIHGYAARSVEMDTSDRTFYPMALWALNRTQEAADVAVRVGQPAFARMSRAWETSLGIVWDPNTALERLNELALEVDPETSGWDSLFTWAGLAVTHLILGQTEAACSYVDRLHETFLRYDDITLGSLRQLPDMLTAMTLAQLGQTVEARALLVESSRAVLRDRYPLVGNECLLALAYITACEGDAASAAVLLEPVVSDGRVRWVTTFPLMFWQLNELNGQLAADGLESPLPDFATPLRRALEMLSGTWTENPDAQPRIDAKLAEFAL